MKLLSSHHHLFSQHNFIVSFGEQRKIYLEAQTLEPAVQESVQAGQNAENPDNPDDPGKKNLEQQKEGNKKNSKKQINRVTTQTRKSILNGPIPGTPFFNKDSSLLANAAGVALVVPVGLKVAQVGANSVAKVAQGTYHYGGKQVVKGAWERGFGNAVSREKGGYGIAGNAINKGLIENAQRSWFMGLQSVHGIRSAVTGSIATALSATRAVPLAMAIPEYALKPFSWATSKLPILNNVNIFKKAENIINKTREKLDYVGMKSWEWAMKDFGNVSGDIGGIWNNTKGALASILETPLRFGTAAIGPKFDADKGGRISQGADAFQNGTQFGDSLISREKNMGDLRA